MQQQLRIKPAGARRAQRVQLQHVAQTGPVVQLQHVATTFRPVKRVILPCQNGYYDSNIKVLLIVVEEVKKLRYH